MQIYKGDCLDVLKTIPDNSVSSIVSDPPYGIFFMMSKWDHAVPSVEIWKECLRVLKPGGYLLAFAGTRTQHRMACNIEDAGFEIRDIIAWCYSQGFPKSLNISKAIDKETGVERTVVGIQKHPSLKNTDILDEKANAAHGGNAWKREWEITAPASELSLKWDGWGTALKPSFEPITMARKPVSEKTIAKNVLKWDTGAINIDGCRIPLEENCRLLKGGTYGGNRGSDKGNSIFGTNKNGISYVVPESLGRWPANMIIDGCDEVESIFPVDGNGSKARFYYCPKASSKDRDDGLDDFESRARPTMGNGIGGQPDQQKANNKNTHPSVKPTELMRYLCRLVTPKNGIVLDPFMGSGSTGKAAILEGFDFIGIDMNEEYFKIAEARIKNVMEKKEISEQLTLDLGEIKDARTEAV